MNIPVVHFTEEYVPNPNPAGETPVEEFYDVREAILAVCQRFGPTSPESDEDRILYHLIDDQYNDDRYHNLEIHETEAWDQRWLEALVACLRKHSGWAISMGFCDRGHLLLYGDRVMVSGQAFENCHDFGEVVPAARAATAEFLERERGPLKRQLAIVERMLPGAMKVANANSYAYVATFDGYELDQGHAVWVLQTKDQYELLLDIGSSAIRETAVTADGKIHPEYCKDFTPYTDIVPPYWLLTYLVEDRSQTKFNLVDEHGTKVGTVTIAGVLPDDLLR